MILQEAILHIPLSQYAFANSEMNLTIRIRVAKDNILEKIEKILKCRLDFCKIMLKAIVDSLRRMGCPRSPPSVEVRSTPSPRGRQD